MTLVALKSERHWQSHGPFPLAGTIAEKKLTLYLESQLRLLRANLQKLRGKPT